MARLACPRSAAVLALVLAAPTGTVPVQPHWAPGRPLGYLRLLPRGTGAGQEQIQAENNQAAAAASFTVQSLGREGQNLAGASAAQALALAPAALPTPAASRPPTARPPPRPLRPCARSKRRWRAPAAMRGPSPAAIPQTGPAPAVIPQRGARKETFMAVVAAGAAESGILPLLRPRQASGLGLRRPLPRRRRHLAALPNPVGI